MVTAVCGSGAADHAAMKHDIKQTFAPLERVARALGVPVTWLREEAEAGRIPYIRAGRRWLVHTERTRVALERRAEGGAG